MNQLQINQKVISLLGENDTSFGVVRETGPNAIGTIVGFTETLDGSLVYMIDFGPSKIWGIINAASLADPAKYTILPVGDEGDGKEFEAAVDELLDDAEAAVDGALTVNLSDSGAEYTLQSGHPEAWIDVDGYVVRITRQNPGLRCTVFLKDDLDAGVVEELTVPYDASALLAPTFSAEEE